MNTLIFVIRISAERCWLIFSDPFFFVPRNFDFVHVKCSVALIKNLAPNTIATILFQPLKMARSFVFDGDSDFFLTKSYTTNNHRNGLSDI